MVYSHAKGTHNRFWLTVDNSQQNAGRAIWNATALFPILHCAYVEAEPLGKFLATQLHPVTKCANPFCGRIIHDSAGKIDLTAHVGKHLS